MLSPHPVETNIFYFRTLGNNEYKSYGHLADICSFDVLDNIIFKDNLEHSQKIKESYLIPTNIKKIDNGAGMIHGMGQDFIDDDSDKLMLSHSSVQLVPELKQMGSGAPFGSIDILIPSFKDYNYKNANMFLKAYFPDVENYWIDMLLNNEIKLFNSESIIIKDAKRSKFVYLIITGNVEMIQIKDNIHNTLSSGAIIGGFSAINKAKSTRTYRASSYVRALAIPYRQYYAFVKENNLYDNIQEMHEQRTFLENTWLFGESISYAQLNKISSNLLSVKLAKNDKIQRIENYGLKLIKSGEVSLKTNNKEVLRLSVGDFFDEDYLLYADDLAYDAYTITKCEIISVKR